MSHNIPSPLPGLPRAAPRAGAAPVRLALELLLLALLLRLFPRLRASLPVMIPGATPLAIPFDLPAPEYRPSYCYDVYGRAPHAAVVALGLVPDWALVGAPGRGMRRGPPARLQHRHTRDARVPPPLFCARQIPSRTHAPVVSLSYLMPRLPAPPASHRKFPPPEPQAA